MLARALIRRNVIGLAILLGMSGATSAAETFADAARAPNPLKQGVPPTVHPHTPRAPTGTVTTYTVRATFQAAFPGLPMETFEGGTAPPGGFSVCDAPVDSTGDAACGFAPGEILAGAAYQDNPGPDAGAMILLGAGTSLNPSQALVANTFADAFDIVFDPPVTAAGMDIVSTPAPGQGPPDLVTFSVFDANNVLIDTIANVNASGAGNFFGVSSATPIGRVSILSANNQAEGVDNVEFAGQPSLTVSNSSSVDQCTVPPSNVNGILEPGEGLALNVELTAVAGGFTGITATLTSATPGVTILDGVANYPNLAAGASANGDAPFSVEIDGTVACLSQVDFDLAITSNEGSFNATLSNQVGAGLVPTGLPLAIPDNNPTGVTSDLVVTDNVTLTDVNVRVAGTHTWVGDLTFTLTGPNAATVVLLDRPGVPNSGAGCNNDDFDVTFDDASMFDPELHCAGTTPWYTGSANPVGTLSAFNGISSAGTWTLSVNDQAGQDIGTIDDWELITTPAISGTCSLCNNSGLGQQIIERPVPALNWQGLLALAGLMAVVTVLALRRSNAG
jgi:subtilisin-like proprotein convertase family protein